MPTYVAFLRAINLGATRKFPKDGIKAATEAAGGRDVETYINTGNVRLTHSARSVGAVQKALEKAYAAEAGFEVPTIVFTAPELAAIAGRVDELNAQHEKAEHVPGKHYISLYAVAPDAALVKAVVALTHDGETCVIEGRAAHALLDGQISDSKLLNSREFKALGQGTARTNKVLRTVADKWC